MLAQYAFGIAIIKLEAQHVEVPAGERRKALERITCEFIAEMDKGLQAAQGAVPLSRRRSEVDERCETRRCLKGDGHEGQHAFTPKGGLSPTTIGTFTVVRAADPPKLLTKGLGQYHPMQLRR